MPDPRQAGNLPAHLKGPPAMTAADILISGEARRAMDDKLPIRRMLDFELIVRQSCAPPKA